MKKLLTLCSRNRKQQQDSKHGTVPIEGESKLLKSDKQFGEDALTLRNALFIDWRKTCSLLLLFDVAAVFLMG